jgi:hypothetical protein
MLRNGFGEHNIQGIGDKHIPLIHNVMNTDVVTAVSDRATDQLDVLLNTDLGRRYLVQRRKVSAELVERLGSLGLSSLCNVVAAIKVAKYYGMGGNDVIVTVATDGAGMYGSVREASKHTYFPDGFDEVAAGETFARFLLGAGTDDLLELSRIDRERIFNLGYFTWVEQRGIPLAEFVARRDQRFWRELREIIPVWDEMIEAFNARTGVLEAL